MENLICLDSSVLISHYRDRDKFNSFFYKILQQYDGCVLSIVAEFEILIGATKSDDIILWTEFFSKILIIPYTSEINCLAIEMSKKLRNSGQQLEFKDLVIGATAIHKHLPLATLNSKHFDKLDSLLIITPFSFI